MQESWPELFFTALVRATSFERYTLLAALPVWLSGPICYCISGMHCCALQPPSPSCLLYIVILGSTKQATLTHRSFLQHILNGNHSHVACSIPYPKDMHVMCDTISWCFSGTWVHIYRNTCNIVKVLMVRQMHNVKYTSCETLRGAAHSKSSLASSERQPCREKVLRVSLKVAEESEYTA